MGEVGGGGGGGGSLVLFRFQQANSFDLYVSFSAVSVVAFPFGITRTNNQLNQLCSPFSITIGQILCVLLTAPATAGQI